ncbi:transcription factor/nuclear export subunit protein 2-domain-containing protein [Podospora didyma]|uniref:THO complex subunit 2 n=1 Tax=Podospora didyma TaxID=330526 RepID=A0AAE0NZ06_9PEZI|nr:transcription factor/nuclear export subunit protein 2-domain-containing protein [Podospora didyma]
MPPGKRKRNDRGPNDSGPRPSPHRPGDSQLGQHDRGYDGGNRGGRGGRNPRGPNRRDSSQSFGGAGPQGGASSSAGPISPNLGRPSSSSSMTAPPPPLPTAATPQAPPAVPPSVPQSPIQPGYDYSIVTDDRVERWSKGGRQEVIDHGIQSREDEDLTEVTAIFQEILHSVSDGRLPGADSGKVVKEILGPELAEADRAALVFDPHTLFLDTVATFMEVEAAPYRQQLSEFMFATEVSQDLMRLVLDPPLLNQLDLIRDTFVRMGIRQSTNMLYRQANYNLLREETEGYSKLVTELFTISSAEPPTLEVVLAAYNKVMGLIGTFDLHPGRVLDTSLDVFAAVLIKQFRFFIKFLRVSAWWPRSQIRQPTDMYAGGLPVWALPDHHNWLTSDEEEAAIAAERVKRDIAFWDRAREKKIEAFFELGGRRLPTTEEQRLADTAAEDGPDASIDQEWIKITKTLPPPGSRDAAQLLGFKLQFYASEARDADDVLPANLLYLTALLIKVGFISLTHLWEHIWPPDDKMDKVKEKRMKELEEKERLSRNGGAVNALEAAGVLPDDMPPPPSTSRRDAASSKADQDSKSAEPAPEKPKLPEPDEQKSVLLKCLLTIGAIPESLFIIGRYPWILQAYPDLLPLVHRLLNHSVEKVFQESLPATSASSDFPSKKLPDLDQSGVSKGSVKLSSPPARRALRWPFPDKADTAEGTGYRFYWDEWADNVPICQTVDDVFTLCDTLLNVSGVCIGQDSALVAKLASIGSKSLADNKSTENVARWRDLLKRLLVPCLSLVEANCSVVDSVWKLLKRYPVEVRYNIYSEWYEGAISRLPAMRKAFARTRVETQSTMKRLSLTNISQMAKKLAKTAYPSPGIVCKVALTQIESYSNLIDAFVECAKYFTDLGYDVLVWSVLSSLGANKPRNRDDAVLSTSQWLQSLSKFSGKVFQRYSNMDSSPILLYVNDNLSKGTRTDLIILKELISSMGGVLSDLDFTDAQLRAMTGGELLRRETLINLGDKRFASTQTANRLTKALVETKLAGRLLVNIALYRQNAIYTVLDGDASVKLLATAVDDTHQFLAQYLDLLRSGLDGETFNSLIPSLTDLTCEYDLEVGIAFMIWRASIRSDMRNSRSLKEGQSQAKAIADVDGDVIMDSVNGDETAKTNDPTDKGDTVGSPSRVVSNRKADPVLDALQPLIDEMSNIIPKRVWQCLSPVAYVLFWSLQLGDFSFPQESYSAEGTRLKNLANDIMKDRSDMSRTGMNKKQQKHKEILERQKLLVEENTQEYTRYSVTRIRISKQLHLWFPTSMEQADATSDALLQNCILPRIQLGPLDAEYCFRLIKFLHEFSAPNFKLMSLYDRLFNHNRLRAIIYTCTVREAQHLGRFLRSILGDLTKWHGDKTAYEKEALGAKDVQGKKTRQLHGFATTFGEDGKPTAFVEHDAYRNLLFRWHKELNTALKSCLDLGKDNNRGEWMHIRNAISVLKAVGDIFPAIDFMLREFMRKLNEISTHKSDQGDLTVPAQTTYSVLWKRNENKDHMMVQAFRPGGVGGSSQEDIQMSDARDEGGSAPPTLRPTAPTFKPGQGRTQPATEAEDGEVGEVGDSRTRATNGAAATEHATRQPRSTNEPTRDVNASSNHNGGPATAARSITPRPTSSGPALAPGSRPESRSSSMLQVNPNLPNRPNVAVPSNIDIDRFQRHNTNNRRDLPARDVPRDSREPREPRDAHSRDGREPRDMREAREPVREPLPAREALAAREAAQAAREAPLGARESLAARTSQNAREPVGPREPRDYRAPDSSRPERPRDLPPPDRRPVEPPVRDSGRDRDWPGRAEQPPRRNDNSAPPDREGRPPRDRNSHSSSRQDHRPPREPRESRESREPPVPQPPPMAAASQHESQEPPVNPERGRLIAEVDRPEIINPARAALINDTREPQARPPPRDGPRDQGRERPPRVESPRRPDLLPLNGPQPDNARDDRHGRQHRHSDYHTSSREGHTDSTAIPRPERNAEREAERAPGPRDPSYGSGPLPRGPEMDHGRLNQQDPNYGRLNSIQSVVDLPPGPPSGPRGRGRYNARGGPVNGPSMRSDNRFPHLEPIRPPSPERQPPTGPSSTRQPRRSQYDNNNINSGTTISPTTTVPPAGGVHPDRIRQISQQLPAGPVSPIHPDRVNQIAALPHPSGPAALPRATVNTPDRHPVAGPNSGAQPAPPPISTDFPTPTGPASASNDRMRSGGSRQLRGIQNTLERASVDGGRGSSGMRMSRSRTNLAGSDAQILAGSSPVTTPVHERPDPIRDPSRREMSSDRVPRGPEPIQVVGDSRDGGRGAPSVPNGDDYTAIRGDHDRGRRDHHRSDRGSRASRRSSRERSPDRERENKEPRDYRERRPVPPATGPSGSRDGDREMGAPRRSTRESVGSSRDSLPGGRDMVPPRESSHRSHRSSDGPPGVRNDLIPAVRSEGHGGRGEGMGGRSEEYGTGGRGGSSRGSGAPRDSRSRQGDDRGDDRGSRKRRSEGGGADTASHQDKRPRR